MKRLTSLLPALLLCLVMVLATVPAAWAEEAGTEALPQPAAETTETIPSYAVRVNTLPELKTAVNVDGAYVVMNYDLQDYD